VDYLVRQKLQGDKAVQHILSLVDHTHPDSAQLLDDAVVRDGPSDHWRESYVGQAGKSMKSRKLEVDQEDGW
jgi:hypothetical protein